MFLKCVKVCMSWNKINNRNNMHGATIKIGLYIPKYTASHNGTLQMLLLIAARTSELTVRTKRHSYFSWPLKHHTDGRVQSGT